MDQSPLFNELMKRQMGQQGAQGGSAYPPQQANGMWSTSTPPPGPPPQSAAGGNVSPMGGAQSVAPMGGAALPGMGAPQAGGKTNTHPQDERAANANSMTSAYQNGWQPNPMIMRMMMGKQNG